MPLIVLMLWPFVAIGLMRAFGRTKGVIWTLLVGALVLPEAYEFNLPGLPPLDKEMAILAGTFLGLLATPAAAAEQPASKGSGDRLSWLIVLGLPVLLLVSAVITVMNNGEPVIDGRSVINGLGVRDLLTMLTHSIVLIGPFLIAQRYLADPAAHVILLQAFVTAGLAYSLLILFEARMSPQLHNWIYGYFQHSWLQHIRGGSFRPIVFLKHGLVVGMLMLICTMSAFILLRGRLHETASRKKFLFAGLWFLGVLLLSRNFGAVLIAIAFVPLLWFLGARLQKWVAISVMSLFLVFPVLRQTEVITHERTLELVGRVSEARQGSLSYRVENENRFLERQVLKPVTGWGIWGRWRVRDPVTGQDISTSDGRWISVLGERGWLGFLSYFGMMMFPVFLLIRTQKRREVPLETMGIAMILSAIIVYQIANNTIGVLTMIVAGALAGFVWRPDLTEDTPQPDLPVTKQRNRYTRFPHKVCPDRPEASGPHGVGKALS